VAAIKAALARFGQQTPLVVDADNVVRKGNGTLQAALELGWDRIAVVRTPLKGSEATAYAIADNRTSELAEWDDTALAETLRALQSEDFDLSSVGYRDDEVDALIEGLARSTVAGDVVDDPAGEWEGMPEFQHEDQTSTFKVYVHIRNEEDLADFERLVGQKVARDRWAIWHPKAEIGRYADKRYAADGSEVEGHEDDGEPSDGA
jgi:ParB-like chromosome segregation protein Spo0J